MSRPHISQHSDPRRVCSSARAFNPAWGGDPWGGRRQFRGWGPPWGPWLDSVGARRCKGCLLGLHHRRTHGRRGLPRWAAGPGLLSSQPTDSPAQRARGEPRQLWRPQGRGSAGRTTPRQQQSTAGRGRWARPHHTGCQSRVSGPPAPGWAFKEAAAWGWVPLLFLTKLGPGPRTWGPCRGVSPAGNPSGRRNGDPDSQGWACFYLQQCCFDAHISQIQTYASSPNLQKAYKIQMREKLEKQFRLIM